MSDEDLVQDGQGIWHKPYSGEKATEHLTWQEAYAASLRPPEATEGDGT